jgi:hypothetical protein
MESFLDMTLDRNLYIGVPVGAFLCSLFLLFKVSLMTMTGFLDGINDSLVEQNPIDDLEEDTQVNLGFDKALLYKNMVAAEADWLYNLEEWNDRKNQTDTACT